MKPQEPKNFKDILELQKILDSNIHSSRERTVKDIVISMVAEIVEFNEETKESHKTWKTKLYDREKELEELTDIFFFYAQWAIALKDCEPVYLLEEVFNEQSDGYADSYLLIYDVMTGSSYTFLETLMRVVKNHGYTKEDILKTYWKKWQKNMERIGKEWN